MTNTNSFPCAFSCCFLATYQVWGQFLGEVIAGKDGDLLFIATKEGGWVSYQTTALGCLATEHILTSSPWGSPADSSWRVHPHHQSSFPWIFLPSELWPSWSPPVHVTITLRMGEWVLLQRAGMKPVLKTGLAQPASAGPQTHSKSTEINSCVSIKDLPHTKWTRHWKIPESWSFIGDRA